MIDSRKLFKRAYSEHEPLALGDFFGDNTTTTDHALGYSILSAILGGTAGAGIGAYRGEKGKKLKNALLWALGGAAGGGVLGLGTTMAYHANEARKNPAGVKLPGGIYATTAEPHWRAKPTTHLFGDIVGPDSHDENPQIGAALGGGIGSLLGGGLGAYRGAKGKKLKNALLWALGGGVGGAAVGTGVGAGISVADQIGEPEGVTLPGGLRLTTSKNYY